MNLKHLSDNELLERTRRFVRKEREGLIVILHHLIEIDSRRLYSALGYSSLYDYCMTELKHSESEACRRIAAMRLLRELPQIEAKISSGALTLTNLNLAQNFFGQEKKTKGEYSKAAKLEVLLKLSNKSCREAGRELAKIAPVKARDRVQFVSENEVQLMAAVTPEALKKLERLKGVLAHSCPDMSFGELIEKLAELGLSVWDKSLADESVPASIAKAKAKASATARSGRSHMSVDLSALQSPSAPKVKEVSLSMKTEGVEVPHVPSNLVPSKVPSKALIRAAKISGGPAATADTVHIAEVTAQKPASRYIPAAVRRYIWKRDKLCQICGSDYALQIDHILPMAMGGVSEAGNLRLLCRHCNQRAAVELLGRDKMDVYLSGSVGCI